MTFVPPTGKWPALTAQWILDTLNRGVADAKEQTLRPFLPRIPLDGYVRIPPGSEAEKIVREMIEEIDTDNKETKT